MTIYFGNSNWLSVIFPATGAVGGTTMTASSNVSSVTKTGTGAFTVNFASVIASFYTVMCGLNQQATTATQMVNSINNSSQTTSSLLIDTNFITNATTLNARQPTEMYVTCWVQ